MMRGEIDSLYEVGREAADFVEAESTVRVYSFARPYVHVLGFNVRRPVFRRPEVRQAISEAIDRNAILHAVLRDRGRVAEGYVWPSHWAYRPVGARVRRSIPRRRAGRWIGSVFA